MKSLILAIESSCDDSSIAVIDKDNFECLFHKKISQDLAHSQFGGVVPELAARLHTTALPQLLEQCKGYFSELCAVAVTSEPGLSVSLLGGVTMAKVLSASLKVPLIAVNHLVGHFYSLFLTQKARLDMGVLLVSGGHTMLLYVDKIGQIKLLGQSLDDAFGESFDKVAKMLGLGYPGGVFVEKLAQKAVQKSLEFSVPLRQSKELNFSFSGLKNAVRVEISKALSENSAKNANSSQNFDLNSAKNLNLTQNSSQNSNSNLNETQKSEIAYAFERAAVAHLMDKVKIAFKERKFKAFGVVGGASANLRLRGELKALCEDYECELLLAPLEFCADNALMIARAACELYERDEFVGLNANIISPKNQHFFRV